MFTINFFADTNIHIKYQQPQSVTQTQVAKFKIIRSARLELPHWISV